ncbi:hypothetical protein [Paenibacillus cremeus]|uniref:Uncharacterized protein n=1 Tax=Paenibacillus cremeus TaxID=2163881 RepID=A0A559KGX7_9BACL|nr:hypothetical protein [Paenibacillus cremeus]TVY11390.1 hypothetical protein FPZ49_03955 [Paenibacillus cremeus]
MDTKRCLFCNKIVSFQVKDEKEIYTGCCCAPESNYSLTVESYASFASLSLDLSRQAFPIISGYIRNSTVCGEKVDVSFEDLETICNSADIPVTIEEKEYLLLRYLYKQCTGPDEPIHIRPLSEHYNLAYSRNLQEFVYIIERLRDKKWIERSGTTFQLTKDGWDETAARMAKIAPEPCVILLHKTSLQQIWRDLVPPLLKQYGFHARFVETSNLNESLELISECKLLVADLSDDTSRGCFAAGYALGIGIHVISTIPYSLREALPRLTNQLNTIYWEKTEDLSTALRTTLYALSPSVHQEEAK